MIGGAISQLLPFIVKTFLFFARLCNNYDKITANNPVENILSFSSVSSVFLVSASQFVPSPHPKGTII